MNANNGPYVTYEPHSRVDEFLISFLCIYHMNMWYSISGMSAIYLQDWLAQSDEP